MKRSQATNDEEGYRSGDSENDEFSDDESNDGEERLDNVCMYVSTYIYIIHVAN